MLHTVIAALACCASAISATPLSHAQHPFVTRSGITSWALNPAGDLAVVRTSAGTATDLHLLAINAQYTIPTTSTGRTPPDALYTFIANDTFVTFAPSTVHTDEWVLTSSKVAYSIAQSARPPHVTREIELDRLEVEGRPRNLLFAQALGMLIVLEDEHIGLGGRARLWEWDGAEVRKLALSPTGLGSLLIEEMVTNGSMLVFTAYNETIRPPGTTTSQVFTFDLLTSRLTGISSGQGGHASSPVISQRGDIAWLEQRDPASSAARRYLWLSHPHAQEVDLDDFDLDPSRCLFWRDGRAIALLAHDSAQSLYQLWTPDASHARVERVPTTQDVLSAIHVGVTPLNHSHYIGVQSGARGDDVWVISSDPWDQPAEGFENIRLTHFTQ